MKNTIKEFITENSMITRGDTIWVAFSGGADSACLLHILKELENELGFTLKAVHINHMLRGKESDGDESFCGSVCERAGIPFFVYYANVRQLAADMKMTIEQAGRRARYDIFSGKCDGKVAVAHNMNDNAETLLMNLIRGTGMAGLSGISCVSGKYIRPLLKTSRAAIEEYCSDNNIEYINDSSNEDTVYFRNAIRHNVIPLLNTLADKDVVPVINRAMESISIDNDFLNGEADIGFEKNAVLDNSRVIIDNEGIASLHPSMVSRIVRKAVELVKGNLKDVEGRNTELLLELIEGNRTGSAVMLPEGVSALVQFGKTIISKEEPDMDFEYTLPVPGKISVTEQNMIITTEICDKAEVCDLSEDIHYFDLLACNEGLMVRNRRNGDIIKPWKGSGTAKLKKYFIDKKIERSVRNRMMLITCGNSVVFADGMAYGVQYMPIKGNKVIKVIIERR